MKLQTCSRDRPIPCLKIGCEVVDGKRECINLMTRKWFNLPTFTPRACLDCAIVNCFATAHIASITLQSHLQLKVESPKSRWRVEATLNGMMTHKSSVQLFGECLFKNRAQHFAVSVAKLTLVKHHKRHTDPLHISTVTQQEVKPAEYRFLIEAPKIVVVRDITNGQIWRLRRREWIDQVVEESSVIGKEFETVLEVGFCLFLKRKCRLVGGGCTGKTFKYLEQLQGQLLMLHTTKNNQFTSRPVIQQRVINSLSEFQRGGKRLEPEVERRDVHVQLMRHQPLEALQNRRSKMSIFNDNQTVRHNSIRFPIGTDGDGCSSRSPALWSISSDCARETDSVNLKRQSNDEKWED